MKRSYTEPQNARVRFCPSGAQVQHLLIESGHQYYFITMSSGPPNAGLTGNPASNSWRTAGEPRTACSRFSMVDALAMRGRRGVVPASKLKLPRCGAEEGRVGKGGRGAEGGGLAPRMIRRDLHVLN